MGLKDRLRQIKSLRVYMCKINSNWAAWNYKWRGGLHATDKNWRRDYSSEKAEKK